MNDHSCDLLLPNGSRSNRLKSGINGFCFVHTFYPGIVPARGSKAPDLAPEPLNQAPLAGPHCSRRRCSETNCQP